MGYPTANVDGHCELRWGLQAREYNITAAYLCFSAGTSVPGPLWLIHPGIKHDTRYGITVHDSFIELTSRISIMQRITDVHRARIHDA